MRCHGCSGGDARAINIVEASQACDATRVRVCDVGYVEYDSTADLDSARRLGSIRDDSGVEQLGIGD